MSDASTPTAEPRGRIVRAVFNYGLGGYLPQIVSLLLLPLYAHYLEPTQMGIVEICTSSQALVVLGMRVGLPGAMARFYFDRKDVEFHRDLITTVAIAVMGASAALLGLLLLVGPMLFAAGLKDVPFHPYMDLTLVSAFFLAAPDIQRRLLQAREQSAFSARLSVAFALLSTGLNVLLVVGFHMKAKGIVLAGLVAAIAFAGVAAFNHRRDLRGRFRPELLRPLLAYGLPLVPHQAAAWAQQLANRWVLTATGAIHVAGMVGIASRCAAPLAVLASAFTAAYGPVFYSWRSERDCAAALDSTRSLARTVLPLAALGALAISAGGTVLVRYFMRAEYHGAAELAGWIATPIAVQMGYTIVGMELFYSKRTGWVSLIFVSASAVNLVLLWLLLPYLGVIAVGVGQIAGALVAVTTTSLLALKTFEFPIGLRTVALSLGACAAAVALPYLIDTSALVSDVALAGLYCLAVAATVLFSSGLFRDLRDLRPARWFGARS